MTQIRFEYAVRWYPYEGESVTWGASCLEDAEFVKGDIHPSLRPELLERVVEVGDWRVKK